MTDPEEPHPEFDFTDIDEYHPEFDCPPPGSPAHGDKRTPVERYIAIEAAREKQAAYREQRRAWALAHDQPYRDDGGAEGYRSGNAAARTF